MKGTRMSVSGVMSVEGVRENVVCRNLLLAGIDYL